MPDNSALSEFKEGVRLLQDGYPTDAYERFQRASELEKQNPYYLSFLGISMGRAKIKLDLAVDLCKTAVKMKSNAAQLYLNLAEVSRRAGKQDDALEILEQGLTYFKDDDRFKRARAGLGKRRPPVFSLLARGHVLNRFFGKIRHRILGAVR